MGLCKWGFAWLTRSRSVPSSNCTAGPARSVHPQTAKLTAIRLLVSSNCNSYCNHSASILKLQTRLSVSSNCQCTAVRHWYPQNAASEHPLTANTAVTLNHALVSLKLLSLCDRVRAILTLQPCYASASNRFQPPRYLQGQISLRSTAHIE